jgi:glycosyltransferase involved in cell wall biosynthesis
VQGDATTHYEAACRAACAADTETARRLFSSLSSSALELTRSQSMIGLGVSHAIEGDGRIAAQLLNESIEPSTSAIARHNLRVLDSCKRPIRVAVVSLLFNWPSTGGGTVHSAETVRFLQCAGFETRHFYVQSEMLGVGRVDGLPNDLHFPIAISDKELSADNVRKSVRSKLDGFTPDYVIITDSWNCKPLLAEAAEGYPYFVRIAALECLCPLNNVRMLPGPTAGIVSCPKHQFGSPTACKECVSTNRNLSGSLHSMERELAGFDDSDYVDRLKKCFEDADGVLVVNPLIREMVAPYSKAVHVVPSGFDASRFPWPWPRSDDRGQDEPYRIFFAGLVSEYMKGFHVLQEAGELLSRRRSDFRIIATGDPAGLYNEFTEFVGWLSQDELPAAIRSADLLVFPTVAEEALGRSAVEAMAVGRPVVASRIGGLQTTVLDGATGLLFEPGNAADLANKIERLLDDGDLRKRLGDMGRMRFEEHFTWEVIIDQFYRKLLTRPQ